MLYSHKLIALIRVDAGSCGKGVGCVAGSDVEGDVDEVLDVPGGWVLEVMPNNTVVVSGSTRSGVAILRRATRADSEQVVMKIAVWGSFAVIRVTKLKVDQVCVMAFFEPHGPFARQI